MDMSDCLMIPASQMGHDMWVLDGDRQPYQPKGTVAQLAIMSAIVNSDEAPMSNAWLERDTIKADLQSGAVGAVAHMAVVASNRDERLGREGLLNNPTFTKESVPDDWVAVDDLFNAALDNGITFVDNTGKAITFQKPTPTPEKPHPMMIAGVFMSNPDNTDFELAAFDPQNLINIKNRTKKAFGLLEVNAHGGTIYGADLIFGDGSDPRPKSDCIVVKTTESLPLLNTIDNPAKIPGIRGVAEKYLTQSQLPGRSRRVPNGRTPLGAGSEGSREGEDTSEPTNEELRGRRGRPQLTAVTGTGEEDGSDASGKEPNIFEADETLADSSELMRVKRSGSKSKRRYGL